MNRTYEKLILLFTCNQSHPNQSHPNQSHISAFESVSNTPSFYIPRINFEFTKNDLKSSFEEMCKVTVTRVDFVSFNSEKGVGRSAYIHFEKWSQELKSMYAMIHSDGHIQTIISSPNVYDQMQLQVKVLINKKPVPETALNLNQVAANVEFLADQIKTQQTMIDSQKLIINQQQQVIYSLLTRMDQIQYGTF